MDLSVLSAENYDDRNYAAEARATDRPYPTRYYGGIVISDEDEHNTNTVFGMVNPASQEVRPWKKSGKNSRGSEENSNGRTQRGRPRFDPRDATAADRRRTQIRLAQRAYRLRKESTIASLTKRVSELEGTLDEMNKTFLAFKDSAMASGIMSIKPQLAQDLKQTTEHFFSLTRIAVPVSDHKDEQTDDLQTHELDSPESDATRTRKRIKRDWSSRDATSRTSSLPAEAGRPLSIGYGVTYEEDKSNRSQENDHPPRSLRTDGSQGDRQSITMQQSRVGLPEMTDYRPSQSPMLDRLLHTPFTYSFQESTFARRLHRASIESAYHILTNPNSRKEDIYRIFKFAFFYADVNTITYRLRELLKRSSSESLENWAAPFFHLGGAGTHYPRIDARGHSILPPNMRAIGPLLSPETPQPENATTEQLLTLTGWDGEWFDANDVEQYLRTEKGLRLDGQSAFGEVEVPLSPFPTAASSDHTSPNSSSTGSLMERQSCVNDPLSSSELIFQSHDYFNTTNGLFNQINVPDMTMDLGDSLPPSESKVTDPFKYQLGHHGSTLHSLETEIPQTTLTIDVSRLLSEIIHGGVCLGNSPGWRRADVDLAFHTIMQEAF